MSNVRPPEQMVFRNLFAVAVLVLPTTALAQDADAMPFLRANAIVAWHQVSAPFGKFLLLRGRDGVCAIRFLKFSRREGARPPTAFHSGEERVSSVYQWHYLADAKGSFTSASVKHGSGTVADGPLVGIGRLAFRTEDGIVQCGPMRAAWLPPSSVSFFEKDVPCRNAPYALAPTRWQNLAEIDFKDKRLRWFQCEEDRETFPIPIGDL